MSDHPDPSTLPAAGAARGGPGLPVAIGAARARDDAQLYAANVQALLPAMHHHFAVLVAAAHPRERARAQLALGRLIGTVAELSTAFHVEDCALLAATAADTCDPDAPSVLDQPEFAALTDALADVLAYLAARVDTIAQRGRLVSLKAGDRAVVARLLARLAPPDERGVGASTADTVGARAAPTGTLARGAALPDPAASWGSPTAGERDRPLSDDDAAIVRAFQEGALRRATRPILPAERASTVRAGLVDAVDQELAGGADSEEDLNDIAAARVGFVAEMGDDLRELRRALLVFERDLAAPATPAQTPEQAWAEGQAHLETMAYLAHKIKGEAGMVRLPVLVELVQFFQEQVDALRSRRVAADERAVGLLTRAVEDLERAHEAISAGEPPTTDTLPRLRALTALLLEGTPPPADASVPPAPPTVPAGSPPPVERADSVTGRLSTPSLGGSGSLVGGTASEPLLRVDLRRVDDLSRRVGALAANRAEMVRTRGEVARLRLELEAALARLNGLSVRLADLRPVTTFAAPPGAGAATPLPSELARLLARTPGVEPAAALPDVLPDVLPEATTLPDEVPSAMEPPEVERYGEFDQLVLALHEAVADVETCGHGLRAALAALDGLTQEQEDLAEGIQQAIMRVRLIPLSEPILPLHRAVRALAGNEGKSVGLRVLGEMTEIDREVSEGLGEALMQLARNAVAHGIEEPEVRAERGKPAEGTITIAASQTGDEVHIQVSDDGEGMKPDALIAAARTLGLLDEAAARAITPADALNLIFEHGFSTRPRATATAGHGIGMAEVRAILTRLHGTIQVHSTPGQGTQFDLRIPISFSNIRALEVRVAGQGYIVPAAFVRQTVPLPDASASATGSSGGSDGPAAARRLRVALEEADADLPVRSLAELLDRPYLAAPRETALVVDLGRQRTALVVERVADARDVVVRALPAHLQRRAIHGATITPSGEVLLLLDLPELVARRPNGSGGVALSPPAVPPPTERPSILVVDDSLTIRQTLADTFAHAGYGVATAHDGMEALEQILRAPPRIIILDVEMPRLDGYELLALLRARPDLAGVRVAMLTSKATERHRRHAESLGADAFMIKPCTEDDLLTTVRRLLALPG